MKDLVIITPSRGRPENIRALIESMKETETTADLCVVVDSDDEKLKEYQAIQGVAYLLTFAREGKGMAKPLNKAANFLLDNYRNFAFLGDDHRPRTEHWDRHIVAKLDDVGGICYGNDLMHGENLATAAAMTQRVVKELGGMVPQRLAHLYLDNFWMKLGRDIGALSYLGFVIIEHLHPLAGKADWDAGYEEVNANEMYQADSKAFFEYVTSDAYSALIERLIA